MYEQETNGIIIRAEPSFLEGESTADRFVWAYTIEIENCSNRSVQLLRRHWRITDAHGRTQEVHGDGVIGEQPVIEPGEAFSYSSFCPLAAPSGWMAGEYDMADLETGDVFAAAIPPFALDGPNAAQRAN